MLKDFWSYLRNICVMLESFKKKENLIIIIGGRLLQIVIMLISIRVITTFLSPAEVGNYNLLLTILAFFNLVFLNPPGMYFSRHIIQWNGSNNLLNGLFVFVIWMVIVSFFSVLILALVYKYLNYEHKYNLDLFLLYIVLSAIFSTLHRNMLYGLNMLEYRKQFVLFLIITLSLGIISSFLIIHFLYNYALGWAFGIIISEIIVLYPIYRVFIRDNKLDIQKIKISIDKKKIKEILIFCIPIAITVFLMWGQNTAYKIIIDYKYSAEILGYIAVGLGVSSAVFSALEGISMQYFNPIFYKNILNATREERAEAWNKIAQYMVPIYILVTILTISISEYLVSVLVDNKFHNSYIYTSIGAGIEFFRVMTNLLNNVSQAEKNTKVTIIPYFIGFIISISIISFVNFKSYYFMIPTVLLVAYLSVFIYMYFNMKKLLDIKYDINSIFKSVLLGLPLLVILCLDININIIDSILILFLAGVYFLFAVYILLKGAI
jgi:O-antigen/teichoic acid export membrane protein